MLCVLVAGSDPDTFKLTMVAVVRVTFYIFFVRCSHIFLNQLNPFDLNIMLRKVFFLIRCVACVFLNIQISQAACVRIYIFECMRKVH